ncbi:TetR/AcrR family transcriptional regulator [Nodosilinea sp. LEGE 07088]|uniref:TetR/AcrR family transcriptional regulator n=1 Tax=Nodosilinea sp. LEGE 07088 TaxID=2777968 RepID=UPI0018808888|nr:TetR/AcrR family transcriptional regulator [Nodosilinea sp. LEGE 07088]MBE9140124.1 TetR/AcrR family transcriptional regulator [Nodosilinea sp. LEGE 07088]
MARSSASRPCARDRILAAASELFYKEGVHCVGIDRIIAESGVAKMSLYNHFKSKDALIAAWLEDQHQGWREWFQAAIARHAEASGESPLLAIFDALREWIEKPNFRGCAFINSAVELVDAEHPGYQITLAHQQAVADYILTLVKAANLPNPEDLAKQLMILMQGATVVAMMHGCPNAAGQAKAAAAVLIEAASP